MALSAGWATATFVALTMHGFWWPGRQTVVVLPLAVLAAAWWVGGRPASGRAVVRGGLVAGVVAFGWLVAEGAAGRATWVVGFEATRNPLVRLLRPVLPDLRAMAPTDTLLLVAWGLVLAALAAIGWRAGAHPVAAPPVRPDPPARQTNPKDHR